MVVTTGHTGAQRIRVNIREATAANGLPSESSYEAVNAQHLQLSQYERGARKAYKSH